MTSVALNSRMNHFLAFITGIHVGIIQRYSEFGLILPKIFTKYTTGELRNCLGVIWTRETSPTSSRRAETDLTRSHRVFSDPGLTALPACCGSAEGEERATCGTRRADSTAAGLARIPHSTANVDSSTRQNEKRCVHYRNAKERVSKGLFIIAGQCCSPAVNQSIMHMRCKHFLLAADDVQIS